MPMTLMQAVELQRRAQSELRAIGLDVCDTNERWWLALSANERRFWKGEDPVGDFDGNLTGPPASR